MKTNTIISNIAKSDVSLLGGKNVGCNFKCSFKYSSWAHRKLIFLKTLGYFSHCTGHSNLSVREFQKGRYITLVCNVDYGQTFCY